MKKCYKTILLLPLVCMPLCCSAETGNNADDDVQDAVLALKAEENMKMLSPMAFGANTQCLKGPSWTEERFLEAVGGLHLNHLRYPGGQVGNYFDWRNGVPAKVNRRGENEVPIPQKIWIKTTNVWKLEDLKRALDYSPGTEATFMLNMLTDNLESSLEMLRTAKEMGIPFHYVELGNEFYLSYVCGGDWKTDTFGYYAYPECFPTAKSYTDECTKWIAAIRKEFPDVKIAYNAANYDGENAPWINNCERGRNWNRDMVAADMDADGVIIHIYTNNKGTRHPVESFIRTQKRLEENAAYINETFGELPVWMTEFNVKSDQNKYMCQWSMALHSIFMSMEVMLIPQVEIMDFHNLTAEYPVALIYYAEQEVPTSKDSGRTVTVSPYEYSASGYGYRFLGRSLKGAVKIGRVDIGNAPVFSSKEGRIPLVLGYRIQTADGRDRVLLLNLSDESVRVDAGLDGRSPFLAETEYAVSLTDVIASSSQVYGESVELIDGAVVLPPFSMSCLNY